MKRQFRPSRLSQIKIGSYALLVMGALSGCDSSNRHDCGPNHDQECSNSSGGGSHISSYSSGSSDKSSYFSENKNSAHASSHWFFGG